MANYNEHKCLTCGETFEYCRHCAITPIVYKAEGFCSEQCSNIFSILSKHGCNLITADETLKELSAYKLDEIALTESILTHIDKLKSEAGVKIEETVESKVVVEETTEVEESTVKNNKNNKTKW